MPAVSPPWDTSKPMGTPGGPPGPPPFAPSNVDIPPLQQPWRPSMPPKPPSIPASSMNPPATHDTFYNASSNIHSSLSNFTFSHNPRPFDGGTSFPNQNDTPSSHITFGGPSSSRSRRASSTETKRSTNNNLKRTSPAPSGKSTAKSKSSTHTTGSRRKKLKDDTKKVAESVKSQSKSALSKLKGLASSEKKKKLGKKRKQKTNSPFKLTAQLENPTDVAEGVVPEGAAPATVDVVLLPGAKQEDTKKDREKGKELEKKKSGFGGWFGGKK